MILAFVFHWDRRIYEKIILCRNETSPTGVRNKPLLLRKKCSENMYFSALFVRELKNSPSYRNAVLTSMSNLFNANSSSYIRIRFFISFPTRHIIDYRWNDLLNYLSYEKRELDSALAWLSTLGGAFSALGDNFQNCALMAGRISMQQLKLACKMGDPRIVARSRLYYALSLMQQKRLKESRYLVQKVYDDAVTIYVADTRLKNMCLGIWSKLQFEWCKKYKRKSIAVEFQP